MMNLLEFQEYIDSFHKEKGQYSMDDLLKIGVKFKQLPVKQRNWETLHQLLGIYGFSADAYRQKVNRYIKRNDIKLNPQEEGEIFKNDYIEKQKVRDWYNAYRRDIREGVRVENFLDEIKNAANKFSKLSIGKCITDFKGIKDSDRTESVLMFSDLHIGVDCDNHYNKFDLKEAEKRLTKLVNQTIKYCKINKTHTLHVLNLGDLIAGLIHTNARVEQQMDVAEQIICAGELLSNFLAEICKAAPNITYSSVFDNHSRAIANKNEHIEKEQFSRVIDWWVKERLKDSNIQFLENDIDGGIGRFKLKSGKVVMFAHGHEDGRNNSVQNFIGLTQEWVDYICLAHYHNPASKDYQGCKVFINGSIVGTESYAFGRRLFTKPSQKLLIFNQEDNDIQDIDIDLSSK